MYMYVLWSDLPPDYRLSCCYYHYLIAYYGHVRYISCHICCPLYLVSCLYTMLYNVITVSQAVSHLHMCDIRRPELARVNSSVKSEYAEKRVPLNKQDTFGCPICVRYIRTPH